MLSLKVVSLIVLLAVPAVAQTGSVGEISVRHAWSRATPPAAPVAAGFATIINTGKTADRLIGITSAISERVEVHETTVVDGIARMRAVADLQIAAGDTVVLKPSGLHLMFIKPKAPLREGDRFKATLTFERAGAIDVEFSVQRIGARDAPHKGHGAKAP